VTPLLTACVPTIPRRESLLSRLLFTLTRQPALEVIVAGGPAPMGDKVNAMFAAARGRYVAVIDDDDMVTEAYIAHLASSLQGDLDFVGHDILWLEDGRFAGLVSHSLDGDKSWNTLARGVSPKCPTRTSIARSVSFGNEYSADRPWSHAVQRVCTEGGYIPSPLYVYDHWNAHMVGTNPDDHRFDQPQRNVGTWPYDPGAVTWLSL
jgi:hypothetical protein